jgi:hypothetical protein
MIVDVLGEGFGYFHATFILTKEVDVLINDNNNSISSMLILTCDAN